MPELTAMVTNALLAAKENTPYLPRHRALHVPKVISVRLEMHFQIHVTQILTNLLLVKRVVKLVQQAFAVTSRRSFRVQKGRTLPQNP